MSDNFTFIACSDLHIRKDTPLSRKDLFYSSVKRKIIWLFSLAQQYNAYIICGGDVFENASVPNTVIREIIRLALKYNVKLLSVYGQHDLRYHVYSSYKNTPLSVLLTALNTQHLDEQYFENDLVHVQGASWNKNIPEAPINDKIKILATHRMVSINPLWPGHIDFNTPEKLLLSDYDIIVSGDNHNSFIYEKDNKYVINSGALTRSKIDQINYHPRVVLVNIDKNKSITYEWVDVPIREAKAVFKEEKIEEYNIKLEEAKKQLEEFTDKLNKYTVDRPDYMYNLIKIKEKVTNTFTLKCIDNIIERVAK